MTTEPMPIAEVSAEDREAAARWLESIGEVNAAYRARHPVKRSGGPLSQAFARHRLAALAGMPTIYEDPAGKGYPCFERPMTPAECKAQMEEYGSALADAERKLEEARRERDTLHDVLSPFVDLKAQNEAWGIISKKLDDLSPVKVTVTKAQMKAACAAFLAAQDGGKG